MGERVKSLLVLDRHLLKWLVLPCAFNSRIICLYTWNSKQPISNGWKWLVVVYNDMFPYKIHFKKTKRQPSEKDGGILDINWWVWLGWFPTNWLITTSFQSSSKIPGWNHQLMKKIWLITGGCSRGGDNWGTLRIPREDWGTYRVH